MLRRSSADGFAVAQTRASGGHSPCHVAVSPDARHVAVANYVSGTLAVFALDGEGALDRDAQVLRHEGSGPHPELQDAPHCHQVVWDGRLLTVTDLGSDRVHRYRRDGEDESGPWVPLREGPARLRTGSGPRHQVVDGEVRLVVGELDSTLTAYRVDPVSSDWQEVASPPGCVDVDAETVLEPDRVAVLEDAGRSLPPGSDRTAPRAG